MALAQLSQHSLRWAAGAAAHAAAAGGLLLPQQLAAALQQRSSGSAAGRRGFAVVSGEDTHDDFKPKYKAEPASDVEEQIKQDIAGHKVFIYMKGTPDAPQCGFSNMACRILDAYDLKYGSRNVLADPGVREGIKKFTGWPTIPQVFVRGEFVGGSDILMELHKAGELNQLAEELAAEK